jgi:hypothetical protein
VVATSMARVPRVRAVGSVNQGKPRKVSVEDSAGTSRGQRGPQSRGSLFVRFERAAREPFWAASKVPLKKRGPTRGVSTSGLIGYTTTRPRKPRAP